MYLSGWASKAAENLNGWLMTLGTRQVGNSLASRKQESGWPRWSCWHLKRALPWHRVHFQKNPSIPSASRSDPIGQFSLNTNRTWATDHNQTDSKTPAMCSAWDPHDHGPFGALCKSIRIQGPPEALPAVTWPGWLVPTLASWLSHSPVLGIILMVVISCSNNYFFKKTNYTVKHSRAQNGLSTQNLDFKI